MSAWGPIHRLGNVSELLWGGLLFCFIPDIYISWTGWKEKERNDDVFPWSYNIQEILFFFFFFYFPWLVIIQPKLFVTYNFSSPRDVTFFKSKKQPSAFCTLAPKLRRRKSWFILVGKSNNHHYIPFFSSLWRGTGFKYLRWRLEKRKEEEEENLFDLFSVIFPLGDTIRNDISQLGKKCPVMAELDRLMRGPP